MWPSGAIPGRKGRIADRLKMRDGRALAVTGDGAWEPAVNTALTADGPVSDEVEKGLIEVLKAWRWGSEPDLPRPTWICPVPSRTHPLLVASLAERLGTVGRLPVIHALARAGETPPQDSAATPSQAATWAAAGLTVVPDVAFPPGSPLVVDDVSRSGWTAMLASVLLAEAGADPAYPLVLLRAR
jgi:ATP-dependent DNA helicase RecQ